MKKGIKILVKILVALILLIFLAIMLVPVIFKEQIKEKVISLANDKVEAVFVFEDFSLSLIRNFPNLNFRLKNVNIIGIDDFEGDTLVGFKSFNLVFDLGSVIGKSGYRVKSIILDSPVANAIVLEDGKANWDIMKLTEESAEAEVKIAEEPSGSLKLQLSKFRIKDARLKYTDFSSGMIAGVGKLDLDLSGNMSTALTDLVLGVNIGELNLEMEKVKYLKNASMEAVFDIEADLENNIFKLGENYIRLNEIFLLFTGSVSMTGDDISTDLSIATADTDFKSVLSMIPAIYMKDFDGLSTEGTFGIDGSIKGIYSASDSILPDIMINLVVENGQISYPALPEKITNININTSVSVDGTDLDATKVEVDKFHFELANNPFDISLKANTLISDPEIDAMIKGKIDLAAIKNAIPMEGADIEGIITMGIDLGGKLSMIEQERYDEFKADGNLTIDDLIANIPDLPPLGISEANIEFTPKNAILENMAIDISGSDIKLDGNLSNYLPYLLKGRTVKGELNLSSTLIDVTKILGFFPADTSVNESDTTVIMAQIKVPENIDFSFRSFIETFRFDPLLAENIRGNIIIKEGVINISETGFESLGGEVGLDAVFNTIDTLSPVVKSWLTVKDVGIKDAFNTFITIQKLAPIAEGMEGDISMEFDFSSKLGNDLMPVMETINGRGQFKSDEIQLVSSPVYNTFSQVLKLGDNFSNRFKDVELEFSVKDGRVFIKPFDTNIGKMKANISGDHGLDQSLNYLVKTEIPSSDLPSAMQTMIDGLAAQALLIGIIYKQPEVIKVNVTVGGTIKEPKIIPGLAGSDNKQQGITKAAEEIVAEKVDEVVEDVRETVSEEARKQADKVLADAEKKAQLVRDEAQKAAKLIRDEAEENALKLIKEAESKGTIAKLAAGRAADALRNEADKKAKLLEEEANKQSENIMKEARERADVILGKK